MLFPDDHLKRTLPVPGSSQPERDANHCVAELRSATAMLGIFGAENMSNSGYELARKVVK